MVLAKTWKSRHYFQSYPIIIKTNQPIRKILQKSNFAGQMVKWSLDLAKYGLMHEAKGSIKAQILVDFMVKLTPLEGLEIEKSGWILLAWVLMVNEASNKIGCGGKLF